MASFVGHHECAAILSQFLPLEVFEAFTRLPEGPLKASTALSQDIFKFSNQTDIRPRSLWTLVSGASCLSPNEANTNNVSAAVEILDVVARMQRNVWNNNELGLKILFLRAALLWFWESRATIFENEKKWSDSLSNVDVVVGGLLDTIAEVPVFGSNGESAAVGSRYLFLKEIVDGPKMVMAMQSRSLCATCYEPNAALPIKEQAGLQCCSQSCLDRHTQNKTHLV
jgi:hypothetical protein